MNIAGTPINLPGQIQNLNSNVTSYGYNLLATGINTLLLGIAIVALFFIIFGGIQWITSEGDPKKVEGARNTIIYSAIGLGIAFFSFLIGNVLTQFLGLRNP